MAGAWRSEWQSFKKSYPSFDKMKGVKADVGPVLDHCEKAATTLEKEIDDLVKKLEAVKVIADKLNATFWSYDQTVTGLETTDPTIRVEFDKLHTSFTGRHTALLNKVKTTVLGHGSARI